MKACFTALAAVAWFISAVFWLLASLQPAALRDLTADMGPGAYQPFNNALRGAARRNTYAALAAMVAAVFQLLALVIP